MTECGHPDTSLHTGGSNLRAHALADGCIQSARCCFSFQSKGNSDTDHHTDAPCWSGKENKPATRWQLRHRENEHGGACQDCGGMNIVLLLDGYRVSALYSVES